MSVARGTWRRNAWLLACGTVALLLVTLLGAEGMVAWAAAAYTRLPVISSVFREDLARQVRVLHVVVGFLGLAAVVAYAFASRAGVVLTHWMLARPGGPPATARRERLRTAVVAVALGYAILLVPIRVVRDVLRERDLAGLSYAERRLRVYGVHAPEPDYAPLAAFRERSGGHGDVLVVAGRGGFGFAEVFRTAFLFPQRLFVIAPAACTPETLGRVRQRYPRAAWVDWRCEGSGFAPEPIGP